MSDIGGPQPDKPGQGSADFGNPGGETPRCDYCGAGLDSGVRCALCGYEPHHNSGLVSNGPTPKNRDLPNYNAPGLGRIAYADNPGRLHLVLPPRPAGTVEIVPGIHVSVERWPNAIHRTLTRWLLGWRWVKTPATASR